MGQATSVKRVLTTVFANLQVTVSAVGRPDDTIGAVTTTWGDELGPQKGDTGPTTRPDGVPVPVPTRPGGQPSFLAVQQVYFNIIPVIHDYP